jgi:hypothetical protein
MKPEDLKEFCHEHYIGIVDTNKRFCRGSRLTPRFFIDDTNYNFAEYNTVQYETETLLTVTIPESELERIVDFEKQVFNNLKQKGHYAMFEVLMEQKEREKYLAEKYPAVKKAFEHYSLMLKIAESGEL